ncbi:MAG: spore coat protein [Oscillospiraceae bacterium]|nr:spore coat protein [Oscillospiraceae bacterium]
MNDKQIMENILLTTKGACDLYLHGVIESPTAKVRQAFTTALNDTLCMQDAVYQQMAAKGWYPSEQATQQKRSEVRQKFASGVQG